MSCNHSLINKTNKKGVKMLEKKKDEWYSNRDLLEIIHNLKDDLSETQHLIKKYNGLYAEVKEVSKEIKEVSYTVTKLEAEQQGKLKHTANLYQLSGWLFGLVTIIVLLLTNFL